MAAIMSANASALAAPIDDAVALFQARRFDEAEVRLRQITASEPGNPTACYHLGMALRERGGAENLEQAATWLKKAVDLEPQNADYLADYGGTELMLAERNHSFVAAVRGRDAIEKAVRIDPADTDSRQVLFEFYVQAPWPLGSSAKAAAQVEEISRKDPARGAALGVRLKAEAKDFDGAFRVGGDLLEKNPEDYLALYEYGWCAAASGRNLDRGLVCLEKALNLKPPGPASPTAAQIWSVIGDLRMKSGRPALARAAYEASLKLDSANVAAAAGLAKTK